MHLLVGVLGPRDFRSDETPARHFGKFGHYKDPRTKLLASPKITLNFLIGAPLVSDRPRHLLFRPNKSVLGPLDLFNPFLNFLTKTYVWSVLLWGGTPTILKKQKNTQSAGCQGLVGPWPYGPNDNPKGPTTTL